MKPLRYSTETPYIPPKAYNPPHTPPPAVPHDPWRHADGCMYRKRNDSCVQVAVA